ncbi:MAG TPA: hypothetical protein VI456_11875 [Polyangia bacterium]
MKTCLWLMVGVAAGLTGLLGCAQQQLGGGPPDAGVPGDDAGCGPLGKMVCAAPISGCGPTTSIAPVCLNGSWTCPPNVGTTLGCEPPICGGSLPFGCTCNPATGVTTCADAGGICPADTPDGSVLFCVASCGDHTATVSTCEGGTWRCPSGTIDIRDCPRDGGTSCPSLESDGGFFACGCGSDSTLDPVCVGGSWSCPPATGDLTVCPRYCSLSPPPPGCTCNPASGALTCKHDGGADAAPDGHGG